MVSVRKMHWHLLHGSNPAYGLFLWMFHVQLKRVSTLLEYCVVLYMYMYILIGTHFIIAVFKLSVSFVIFFCLLVLSVTMRLLKLPWWLWIFLLLFEFCQWFICLFLSILLNPGSLKNVFLLNWHIYIKKCPSCLPAIILV